MRMKRIGLILGVVLGIACIGVGILFADKAAAVGRWGRSQNYGYFYNRDKPFGFLYPGDPLDQRGSVLPDDYDGGTHAVPNYIDSVAEYMAWLKDRYAQGQPRQNMIAYIVRTMLGENGGASPTITAADWNELQARLTQPGVTISWNIYHSAAYNVYHQATDDTRATSALDAAWSDTGQDGPAIVVYYNGAVVYALFRSCANPDGNLDGVPQTPDVSPSNTFTASCGTLTINGTAEDSDSPGTSLLIYIYIDGTASGNLLGTVTTNGSNQYSYDISSHVILTSHNFYTIARNVNGSGVAAATAVNATAGPVAVGPCNQALCVDHTLPGTMVVNSPGSFTVRMQLSAWGPPYVVGNPAMMVQVRDPAGTLIYNNANVTYAVSGASSATLTSSAITFTPTTPGVYQMQWGLSGQGLNTFCPNGNDGSWSNPGTTEAGYRPYFTVTGGDILSGGGVRSWNIDGVGGSYVGAGTNLAAIANGDVQNFVTGFGLSTGVGTRGGAGLGFSNSAAGVGGTTYARGFNVDPFVPQIDPSTVVWASGTLDLGDPSLQDGTTYVRSGNLTVFGVLPTGKNITVVVAGGGSAIIAGNTTYGAYSNKSEIPSLTLNVQNGNIFVGSGITEMHGVYIAGGTGVNGNFYSCSSGAAPVAMTTAAAYATCRNKLTVYGAVAANKLVLDRTYGSYIAAAGIPVDSAETFYYSPELWLADDGSTANSGDDKIDSYISLPPVL